MTIDPDIRDQAYQFFIEEASELLDIIEAGLLNLTQPVSVQSVHELMRAAHSIKGGAASVDLEVIKTIAHRLEDVFKALYSDTVLIDETLKTLLLDAYDCLRKPLQAQIETGVLDETPVLEEFDSTFKAVEKYLGPALEMADSFLPNSADLGVDIIASIVDVDVADGLEHLQAVLTNPQHYNCSEELQSQLEVLSGLAELVDLPGFTETIATAQTAAKRHFKAPIPVIELVVQDVGAARTIILAGDRITGGEPSEHLLALANDDFPDAELPYGEESSVLEVTDDFNLNDCDFKVLDEVLNDFNRASPMEYPLDTPTPVPTLDEIWGDETIFADDETTSVKAELSEIYTTEAREENSEQLEATLNQIGEAYALLPRLSGEDSLMMSQAQRETFTKKSQHPTERQTVPKLSAKVTLERLEKMDKLLGELAINRNGLSLQNRQFQHTVKLLGDRFASFRFIIKRLQNISDQLLVHPEPQIVGVQTASDSGNTEFFDPLEMDSYSEVNALLEEILEEVFQLAESIDDVILFAGDSHQFLERQRRALKQMREELMWSRMVPLNQVLKSFSRVIRDLSTTYQKPVQLELLGTEVLVDRVMLEKLYDPLLHLLRNAFDHGIESTEQRQLLGKPEYGTIQIHAYHQGNYTVIEVSDDGKGLDLDEIAQQAVAKNLVSSGQLATMSADKIQQLIFTPGFSTAANVTELSGRGVGLDTVRDSLQTVHGKLSLKTELDKGTVFSLKIPLTLTLAKLLIAKVETTVVALTADSIETILRPTVTQLKQTGDKQFLYWREQLLPIYCLKDLLSYRCQVSGQIPQEFQDGKIDGATQSVMLILQQAQDRVALKLEQIVTEQELVIKPFGKAIAAPAYMNGCTVLADGSLVPVVDGMALIQYQVDADTWRVDPPQLLNARTQSVMIVDDSSALRRTLALTLSKANYHVMEAKDGRDALEQLQQGVQPELIICDVEMPGLNGFEFLSQRATKLEWSKIPTVMLTSRGNHKHRTLAKHLGATDYFTKPYIEQEFLAEIAALLKTER